MSSRMSRLGWLLLVAALVLPLALLMPVALPVYRNHVAVASLSRLGARIESTPGGPAWLRNALGDRRPAALEVVRHVRLDDTQISDAELACLHDLRQLETLSLEHTAISDAGLAHLAGLTSLKELSLRGTQITDAGLAHLRGLTSLEILSLRGTRTTDAGLEQLEALPHLRQLYVGITQTTPSGRAGFRRSHPAVAVQW